MTIAIPTSSHIYIRNQSTLSILTRGVRLLFSNRSYSHQSSESSTANVVRNTHDIFNYTSGRWIWGEEQQLQEWYRKFDILELRKVASEAAHSGSCVSMEKLNEGSYNKAFRLTMANGKAVVARIPNPNAGPDFLTTASQVATMDFVSSNSPVYATWSDIFHISRIIS